MPPADRNLTREEIETHISTLNDSLIYALDNFIPKIKINPNNLLLLNSQTLKCIQLKKYFRRKWFASNRQDSLLKSLISRLSTIIKNLIKLQYSENFEKKLKAIKPDPLLFRNIKNLAGNNSNNKIPLLDGCHNETSCAETMAKHFASIHNESSAARAAQNISEPNTYVSFLTDTPPPPLMQFSQIALADRSTDISDNIYNIFTSVNKILEYIKARKNQKSYGPNKISNYIIKKLPSEYAHYLTIIINNCINLSYFPLAWKRADVVPIPKTPSPSGDKSQYRPISLLCCDSKIFECALKDIIVDHCVTNNKNNPLQFGFTQGKSTSHAITYFLEHVHTGFLTKSPCLAVAIDLQKAFDTVWINGLIYKLHIAGFPDHLCYLILDFLRDRKFKVRFNDITSDSQAIQAGVPQGSILGPILFNLYIADFPVDNGTKAIFYADDILIFKSGRNIPRLISSINDYLSIIVRFLREWKLNINPSKCESILLRKSDAYIAKPHKTFKNNSNIYLQISGQRIVTKDSIQYLGVLINNKLSPIPHTNQILRKARGAFNVLYNILKKRPVTSNCKIIAYKQLIRPIILYGFPGWCSLSSRQMARLRAFERKVLYKCLPANVAYKEDITSGYYRPISKKFLYKEITKREKIPKLKRLDVTCIETFTKFFQKLQFSDIPELQLLINSDYLMVRFAPNRDKFIYKCFPPSMLYLLHIKNKLYNNNILRFYNRRHNSNNLDEYVYDLIEPD